MLLRPYQTKSLHDLYQARTLNPLYVLPTGGGKTVVMTSFCKSMLKKIPGQILWLVHRKELVEQAAATMKRCGMTVGIVMAGHKPDYAAEIQVASIQSLRNRMNFLNTPTFIITDEAHHASAASYKKVYDHWPRAIRVGCTATPYRLDGSGLGDIFNHAVTGATVAQLVQAGYLVAPRMYCWPMPDKLKEIPVKRGEFDTRMMGEVMSDRVILGDIRKHWIEKAYNRKTICFAATVEQSKKIVSTFTDIGIAAEHLDGTTPKSEREGILARLATGETLVVSNVGVLTEGFDCPSVSCIILARLTKSMALWRQMVGREMRPSDEFDDAVCLDHCGNAWLHGSIIEEPDWSLDGVTKKAVQGSGIKSCAYCFLQARSYAKVCLGCDKSFSETGEDRDISYKIVKGKLVEIEMPKAYKQRCFWDDHMKAGVELSELIKMFINEFKEQPIIINKNQLILPTLASMDEKRDVWMIHIRYTASVRAADSRYKDIFGVWPRGKNKWYKEYLLELNLPTGDILT